MPHKFNAARRHKFDKAQYRVINWAEYIESQRQRGDLTIWVSDDLGGHFKTGQWWSPQKRPMGMARDSVVLPL